ncbi:MAG: transketolase [Burkholderiales bacterium]|nr:transketolase [Burkholderiales bacterium]MDE1926720.1 transketolase [Burkholderiales bacterium]MDE2158630.1 transketolase [Burkholderiales bacterium]MDE2504092.1 transketolase [Burkholderiales bacterium]
MASNSSTPVLRGGHGATDARANALRALAIDAVQAANSGHPGAPMGMAEMAVALWCGALRHNPANPHWPDRDRFVLSNGHASMLLYALLNLSGYELPMAEIRRFRQLHSKTPGHPEVGVTPGVETTTGPLGQGFANAVGMALAEQHLGREFNRDGHAIVDHRTYVFLGDGCLMEGISHEAASLAGSWGLNKLIALYDDNGISIDGPVEGWFRDDTPARFRAYGWQVLGPIDGHDIGAVEQALTRARASADKPTLICCRTTIGQGSPGRAGTAKAHGEPLGADEIARTRAAIGWPYAPFEIPDEVRALWDARVSGRAHEAAWQTAFASYRAAFPELAAEFERRIAGDLPADFDAIAQAAVDACGSVAVATRKASQQALAVLAPRLPEMLGGSADLTGSNLTDFPGCGQRHLSWGVREFGMAAALNGVALHGGFMPYGGTFLTFSDYSRNALRMAALMQLRVVHVHTHDSIGLGEDGPTHQAVEQLPSLRLIPGLDVWRPADAVETAVAWSSALRRHDGPALLALSRQALPALANAAQVDGIARGGYVLSDAAQPRAVVIGTGSELQLALEAQRRLAEQGVAVRVVSMPCTNVYDRQDDAWRESVLPRALPAVAVEAAQPDFWHKYVGRDGAVVGMRSFGESAPAAELYRHFGIDAEAVVQALRRVIAASDLATGAPR